MEASQETIGLANITQLHMCLIKIVTFKGGHLMWLKSHKEFTGKFFPLREVPILKRDVIEENHCLIH